MIASSFFFLVFLFSLQVSKIAAYAYSAISQIKVDAKEELVVQFAIPWFPNSAICIILLPISLSLSHNLSLTRSVTPDLPSLPCSQVSTAPWLNIKHIRGANHAGRTSEVNHDNQRTNHSTSDHSRSVKSRWARFINIGSLSIEDKPPSSPSYYVDQTSILLSQSTLVTLTQCSSLTCRGCHHLVILRGVSWACMTGDQAWVDPFLGVFWFGLQMAAFR